MSHFPLKNQAVFLLCLLIALKGVTNTTIFYTLCSQTWNSLEIPSKSLNKALWSSMHSNLGLMHVTKDLIKFYSVYFEIIKITLLHSKKTPVCSHA